MQFGAGDPQNTGHQPSNRGQVPFYRRFRDGDHFFGHHPRIREILRIIRVEDLFLWSSLSNLREKVFVAPQKLFTPSSHATLALGLHR